MTYTQWPTPAEVQAQLELSGAMAGVSDDLSDVIQVAINATVLDFSNITGWSPFLSTGVDSTRNFDAPGPYNNGYMGRQGGGNKLFLEAGLISVTSIKIDGVLQVADTDYKLVAPDVGYPSTKVLFLKGRVYSEPLGIEIIGKWGFGTNIPADAWEAVRDKSAATMLGPLGTLRRVTAEAAQSAQIKAKETGPVRTEYATFDASKSTYFSPLENKWESAYDTTADRYLLI